MKGLLCIILLGLFGFQSLSQVPTKTKTNIFLDESNPNATPGMNGQTPQNFNNNTERKDTLAFEHRDDSKDSINITFRYPDSTRRSSIDSGYDDFFRYYSVPAHYNNLGNNGSAAYSLLFQPFQKIGFDAGFHAYDIYQFTIENTKLYKTNRPFSMLSYQLASGKEQMLKAGHTQNPKPNLNWGFDYRLISAPGLFVTQNTNHNNFRVFSHYQSRQKRYQLTGIFISNNIRSSENGGVQQPEDLLDPNRKDRFTIPVHLGNNAAFRNNPFVTTVLTGNQYRNQTFYLRQSYDLGKRDSVAINDSTTEYLFYPKLRFQHTLTWQKQSYTFKDVYADSTIYSNWYDLTLNRAADTFSLSEKWSILNNDFSIYQFPDTKNPAQFISAGITWQQIAGTVRLGGANYFNLFTHFEYRNRTRNKAWDMLLKADLYFSGLNSGDYDAQASLNRYLNNKWGNIKLFFINANRTPSFVFDSLSSFNLARSYGLKKENLTSFGIESVSRFATIGFKNHLLLNYAYFNGKYQVDQYSKAINVVQASFSKKIRLAKKWFWYLEANLQQTDGAAPVRVPLFYTRNRIVLEGKFFKNLKLSTGVEARYFSPFKANGYSPALGQFYTQDSTTINNLPDISLFAHFNIRSFTGYLRVENLNTMDFRNGFGFVNNNFSAPFYPTPGMMIRFGIQWWFVN
jgi:hypothetical protein